MENDSRQFHRGSCIPVKDANYLVELEAEKYKNGLLKDFFLKSKNDDRRLGFGKHFLLFSIAESNVENYLYRLVSRRFQLFDFETLFPT